MKPTIKTALLGASLALLALLAILPIVRQEAKAAGPSGGAKEQYYVFDAAGGPDAARELQTKLNRLGDEGWKVRTSVFTFLVLAKDK